VITLDEEYKNSEEYLQFIRASEDPHYEQELYDLMRLEG
jgi:hypothetical protein